MSRIPEFSALFMTTVTSICIANSDAAANKRPVQVCAERDLQLVMLVEELGEAKDVAAEKLADATLRIHEGRHACREGRVIEGLAIYDAIRIDGSREITQSR